MKLNSAHVDDTNRPKLETNELSYVFVKEMTDVSDKEKDINSFLTSQ